MHKLKNLVLMIVLSAAATAHADMKLSVMHTRVQSKFGTLALGNDLDQKIAELAKRAGYIVENTELTLDEQACREVDCLPAIAERHGLQALAFVEIGFDKIMNADVVRVSIYRVDASVRSEVDRCVDCNEQKARKLVDVVGTRLMRSDPGSAQPLDHMGLLPPESPAPETSAVTNHRKAFLALGVVSVIGAAGSLAAVGIEAERNGGCTRQGAIDQACSQKRDATGPIIGAAVATGVFAVLGTTFFILAHRESKKAALINTAFVLPSFDQNGAGVVAGGRF